MKKLIKAASQIDSDYQTMSATVHDDILTGMIRARNDLRPEYSKKAHAIIYLFLKRGTVQSNRIKLLPETEAYLASIPDDQVEQVLTPVAREAAKLPTDFTLASRFVRFMRANYSEYVYHTGINTNNGLVWISLETESTPRKLYYVEVIDDVSASPNYFILSGDRAPKSYDLCLPRLTEIGNPVCEALIENYLSGQDLATGEEVKVTY